MGRAGTIQTVRAAVLAAVALCLAGSALAQQPRQAQRDPLNGQYGVVELAPAPAEAARQAIALGDALNALQPQRPGQLDVYVIAASLWGDPVFEREATHGAEALSRHLGAEGRTIVLSAGGDPPRSLPPTNPNAIAAAIGRVGQLIDPDEDLVVLFFTSHGSPDGSMAIRESTRLGAVMRPVHLRDMLLSANVRNRVVIVSSCFSGAFIAPLGNDNTIVMTASQSDRTSFGCQPEREWTFFGDALFAQALPRETSLIAAFDQAKVLIAQWESQRNLTPPSNPQRSVGGRAQALLAQAERNAR